MATTAIAHINDAAHYAANPTTSNRPRFSTQRPGESFAQWQARLADRRMSESERLRNRRAALRNHVMDNAGTLMLQGENDANKAITEMGTLLRNTAHFMGLPTKHYGNANETLLVDRIDQDTAVRMAVPKRFQGKAVSAQTAQDIVSTLTTRFSGFSKCQGKPNRPKWEDAGKRLFAKITQEQELYCSKDFVGSKSDPFRSIRTHDVHTMTHMPGFSLGKRSDDRTVVIGHAPESHPLCFHEMNWTLTLARVRYGIPPAPVSKALLAEQSKPVRQPVTLVSQYTGVMGLETLYSVR